MNQIYIYLAGPITGCTDGAANDWREDFIVQLRDLDSNFVGVSPLRCEPIVGEVYAPEYNDNQFGHPQVIAAKNKMDVERCDLTFAYLPSVGGNRSSVGTQQEIGWAAGKDKPIILVTDDDYIRENAVIKATVPWRFTEQEGGFRKALEVIDGLYSVYI
jgi:nucleoside 2-deoxyribosyltransferase